MKLLLAEDEQELSKALCVILKHQNYSVDAVYDGEEALSYIENSVYDGIILDIMMPKLDGLSVLSKIREMKIDTPVLLLTAKGEIDDKVKGLDLGADDYLTKPFNSKELFARLRAMTRRKSDTLTTVMSFGSVTLNPLSFEIENGKKTAKLSNKEYQMLEILMSNPNVLISTEKFMEKIWGYDSEAEINVVWVYISYLRKKLLQIGADIEIKASRGTGYTLVKTSAEV